MSKINGGDVLARSLKALGVTETFTLHGGHLDAFLVACREHGIQLTDTRHEATAGYAAEAYARATGNVGVCVITAGPGFSNGLTAMVNAWLDAMPVLFIAGSPPLREAALNPLQGGFDQIAMTLPVTKWAYRITNIERIPDIVDKAMRIAASGRPGPVFLEVPIDVMFAPIRADDLALPTRAALQTGPAPAADAVERIIAMLRQAERPAILAGGGTLSRQCAEQLAAFASLTHTPVLFNTKANGVLPNDHPQNAGMAATLAMATKANEPADLIIQLGARAGMFLGGRHGAIIPHGARLIQIDIDGAEIGRIRTPDVAVVADSTQALIALNAAAQTLTWVGRDAWRATLQACRQALTKPFENLPKETASGLLHPYHAAAAVAQALAPETAISFDGGELTAWFQPHGRSPGPGLYMGNGYLGTLGVGQGYAIGMARARPGKPVATIIGDGAVGFHIADFDTMARHRLPITTIVFNNSAWGLSRHGQELVFGKDRTAAVDLEASAYHVVAQGFGCDGELIRRYEEIGPAIRRAQASGRPTCLNLLTDPDVMHPNVTAMIGRVDAEDEIAIPYYENIPVRR
ncbi:MAG: thiamine pyrophosphate-binding protein [Burkholderiaceae bacterium]